MIYGRYSKYLKSEELNELAEQSNNFPGRDIKNICKDAERQWAAQMLRGEIKSIK